MAGPEQASHPRADDREVTPAFFVPLAMGLGPVAGRSQRPATLRQLHASRPAGGRRNVLRRSRDMAACHFGLSHAWRRGPL